MKKIHLITLMSIFPLLCTAGVEDLLITEISATTGSGKDFVEIYNNGASPITLSNVYITDATYATGDTYYYNTVNGDGGGGDHFDFNARFPDGAIIQAGEYQTISINSASDFINAFSLNPTYELYQDNALVEDMRFATAESIATPTNSTRPSGLTGSGEVIILYTWDGTSDLVEDIDYVIWGDTNEAVEKNGVSIDGPDGDSIKSLYLNDTVIDNQEIILNSAHAAGKSWQRIDLMEGNENQITGNGVNNGSDETSEDLSNTFTQEVPTPNSVYTIPPPPAPNIIINEVDAVGTADFVEIKGPVGTSLDDVTLVFYRGGNSTIYNIVNLSGEVIANDGYFLVSDDIGSADTGLNVSIGDESGAVAIYFKNSSNFSLDDLYNDVDFANDIIDAMVFHDGSGYSGDLLNLLNNGEVSVNENSNIARDTESNARCADGKGDKLSTSTYMQITPTAGSINNTCPVIPYYINADPSTPVTLRTTLHEIIRRHTSYPYSASTTDTWEILSFADEDHNTAVDLENNVAEYVWMIYKNISLEFLGGGQQTYNREHTWPQSLGFKAGVDGQNSNNAPRTDAHHLMMSDKDYNNNRGSKYFDNCNPTIDNTCVNTYTPTSTPPSLQTVEYDGDGDGETEGGDTGSDYPGKSNWTNSSVFEVWEFRKGDIARAMFYMDVRYEDKGEIDSSGDSEPDLVLTDNTSLIQGTSGSPAYMGKLSTLLEWHAADPVDDIERERNEVVFSYQGNRNPFIDHPEWVACIFENSCPNSDIIFANGFED